MTGAAVPELEVHLEDAGRRSWWASLGNVVSGNTTAVPSSGSWPALRQRPRKLKAPLHRRLLADGWVRTGGTGRHWWSRIYTRRTSERDPG